MNELASGVPTFMNWGSAGGPHPKQSRPARTCGSRWRLGGSGRLGTIRHQIN
jgi:hypothetical protein